MRAGATDLTKYNSFMLTPCKNQVASYYYPFKLLRSSSRIRPPPFLGKHDPYFTAEKLLLDRGAGLSKEMKDYKNINLSYLAEIAALSLS